MGIDTRGEDNTYVCLLIPPNEKRMALPTCQGIVQKSRILRIMAEGRTGDESPAAGLGWRPTSFEETI